ncbi:MAG TPA: GNAT family N-acetyltransferase [Saprospiraceae bacterium]|jgi:GNAT superfamily N-acetyltransferase|nr:GNAT family N-acetyltransferase [Bacteroidia bacterium]MCO5282264.1 GNAT family N-acetyltransferase [Saprospiraceae bacterium]HNN27260.1 GNAT family N-acetyltransferase [Chitinophagales bacterium]HNQ69621.1 GNAT family N-acetyltransferase [Bacteroidales bacterium]WKZ62361.1 MAG: GNAT family N-acetyltransferase [Saprospiraceae bacterium]
MTTIKRTNSDNLDFQKLVVELDKDLAQKNGDTNDFFVQFNKIDQIKNVVVVYEIDQAVACGAMKEYDNNTMEIKRMFVPLEKRGKGFASKVLQELENWSNELGYNRCILETGNKMSEAIGLYKKMGYKIIPNYGQYKNVESSICFEKLIYKGSH